MKNFILSVSIVLLSASVAFAFADRSNTERVIKENKAFIEFMDTCITNLGRQHTDAYGKLYGLHFNADLDYLQGDYGKAYKKIYASEREMAKVSGDMLREQYIENSKKIFGAIAAFMVKYQNAAARSYLTLGYADMAAAQEQLTLGEGSYRKIFSSKILKFQEGIQKVRRGQRYAFMALFEGLAPETKIAVYNEVVRKEREEGRGLFYSRFLDKDGEAFDEEMDRSFEDAMKNQDADRKAIEEKAKQNGRIVALETKLDSKRRFKREVRAARFMRDRNFLAAEPILREYIPNFNFRLLTAMFDVLANEEDAPQLDYAQMKIHLLDDYEMLTQDSILKEIAKNVQLNDSDGSEDEDGGSGESGGTNKKSSEGGAGDHSFDE